MYPWGRAGGGGVRGGKLPGWIVDYGGYGVLLVMWRVDSPYDTWWWWWWWW